MAVRQGTLGKRGLRIRILPREATCRASHSDVNEADSRCSLSR